MGLLRIDYSFTAEIDTLKGSGKIESVCTAPRWWDIVDVQEEIENNQVQNNLVQENIQTPQNQNRLFEENITNESTNLNNVFQNNLNQNKQNKLNINNENEFDNDLASYVPNNETKCPKCGRELLGTPNVCPYCKNNIK